MNGNKPPTKWVEMKDAWNERVTASEWRMKWAVKSYFSKCSESLSSYEEELEAKITNSGFCCSFLTHKDAYLKIMSN